MNSPRTQNLARILAMSLAALSAFGTTACTDEEVLTAIGAGAIVGGAVAIGAACAKSDNCEVSVGSGYDYCESGYVSRCHEYRDYFGRRVSECRSEYDSCIHRRHRRYDAGMDSNDANDALDAALAAGDSVMKGVGTPTFNPTPKKKKESVVTTNNWAVAFNMSYENSDRMLKALKEARDGKTAELAKLGIAKDDLKQVASYQLPSNDSIQAVAKNLNQDASETREMLKQLLAAAKESR